MTGSKDKPLRTHPRGSDKSESRRMVEEAYNVIYFPPAYIPPKVTEAMNWMTSAALMQLVQSGTITRREAMERMETK